MEVNFLIILLCSEYMYLKLILLSPMGRILLLLGFSSIYFAKYEPIVPCLFMYDIHPENKGLVIALAGVCIRSLFSILSLFLISAYFFPLIHVNTYAQVQISI